MSRTFSLHENYGAEEPSEAGSDRAFGCTVGGILMVIGAAKAFAAAALPPLACFTFGGGTLLVLLGILAPARLSPLNKLWLRVGAVISRVVNPIVLALLFFIVVTPMALLMRMIGKRPLGLIPDRSAATYWVKREPLDDGASNMRRQF